MSSLAAKEQVTLKTCDEIVWLMAKQSTVMLKYEKFVSGNSTLAMMHAGSKTSILGKHRKFVKEMMKLIIEYDIRVAKIKKANKGKLPFYFKRYGLLKSLSVFYSIMSLR